MTKEVNTRTLLKQTHNVNKLFLCKYVFRWTSSLSWGEGGI